MGRLAVAGVCLLWVALVADELDAALGDTTIVEETAGGAQSAAQDAFSPEDEINDMLSRLESADATLTQEDLVPCSRSERVLGSVQSKEQLVLDNLLRRLSEADPTLTVRDVLGETTESSAPTVAPTPIVDTTANEYTYDPPFREKPPWSQRFDSWIERDKKLLDPNMPRLNIGITISIKKEETSIFTNGAKQAAFFLLETLKNRHNVMLINLDLGNPSHAEVDWGIDNLPIVPYEESRHMKFHIVIEEGMQMAPSQLLEYQESGAKCITFRTGNDYFMTIENMMFRQGQVSTIFNTAGYDMIWTIPSFNHSSSFAHIVWRSDVHVAPYVWSPFFLQGTTSLLAKRRKYTPRENKTIAAFEPNLNVVKSSVIPMVIVEALHRRNTSLFHKAIITNTVGLVNKSDEFVRFAASLDITNAKKIWFEGRYKFPWFMSEYGDVVLSHQWENGLNFLYIDALYLRYPLVHNSPYFKECGYYYEGSVLDDAVNKLIYALSEHDKHLEKYAAAADACVYRWSSYNPSNLAGFERLMKKALTLPSRANETRAKYFPETVSAEPTESTESNQ